MSIHNDTQSYVLTAEVNERGDLVLSGQDLGDLVKEMMDTDEYEYFYIVTAANVPRVITALGATTATLLDDIRTLLASHGISASTVWKEWLVARSIPYDFSVWR